MLSANRVAKIFVFSTTHNMINLEKASEIKVTHMSKKLKTENIHDYLQG